MFFKVGVIVWVISEPPLDWFSCTYDILIDMFFYDCDKLELIRVRGIFYMIVIVIWRNTKRENNCGMCTFINCSPSVISVQPKFDKYIAIIKREESIFALFAKTTSPEF